MIRPAHVLLVEPNNATRRMLASILTSSGFGVIYAKDIEGALPQLHDDVDVVLSNEYLGASSSLDLLQVWKAQKPASVFVIITARSSIDGAVESIKGGAYDYLTLPINADELVLLMRRAIVVRKRNTEIGVLIKEVASEDDRGVGQNRPREVLPPFQYHAFVSHATEDKEQFVRPLTEELVRMGLRIWYDEFELRIGDSLRMSIDRGLATSLFGIVILSRSFFAKNWPQYELNGLVSRQNAGRKVILPVWHGVTSEVVRSVSPSLADIVAIHVGERDPLSVARQLQQTILDAMENDGPAKRAG